MIDRAGTHQSRADDKTGKFKKTTRESEKVWAQYEAEGRAIRARTERLKSLRLAKEAADLAAAPPAPVVRKSARKSVAAKVVVTAQPMAVKDL